MQPGGAGGAGAGEAVFHRHHLLRRQARGRRRGHRAPGSAAVLDIVEADGEGELIGDAERVDMASTTRRLELEIAGLRYAAPGQRADGADRARSSISSARFST